MLTQEQGAALKTYIQTTPALNALYVDSVFTAIADYMNTLADPAFTVWRSEVSEEEIFKNGMAWTEVDNLTAGKARIWEWMMKFGSFNPSKPNIRAGIVEVWSGTAGKLAVQASVLGHCKRSATQLEKMFSTGTGSVADPATTAISSPTNWSEIQGL